MVRPGQYRHFKHGHIYEVILCAKHSENEESLVIYRDNSGNIWARPEFSFSQAVLVDGEPMPRFELMERDW
jgi:hypothetical protein